jgi:flagellar hook-basal body protein
MSLFGAMNTAISGLNAQSNAFGNISDNVANAETIGYKRVDTNFIDYLTTSNASVNAPGSVVARPDYVNNVQGTVTQSDNPLGLAIAGQGFFAVSQKTGEANSLPTFSPQKYYTRAGDFQMDKNGYLVNSANEALNGWPVDPASGVVNQNTLAPIQVTQTVYNPVATSTVTLAANLPATPAVDTVATPLSSDIDVLRFTGHRAYGDPQLVKERDCRQHLERGHPDTGHPRHKPTHHSQFRDRQCHIRRSGGGAPGAGGYGRCRGGCRWNSSADQCLTGV